MKNRFGKANNILPFRYYRIFNSLLFKQLSNIRPSTLFKSKSCRLVVMWAKKKKRKKTGPLYLNSWLRPWSKYTTWTNKWYVTIYVNVLIQRPGPTKPLGTDITTTMTDTITHANLIRFAITLLYTDIPTNYKWRFII